MAKVKDASEFMDVTIRRKPRVSTEEYRKKLGLKRLTDFGAEVPDAIPMEPPVGYVKQPSIFENMRNMVKAELARKAIDEGFETEEEAENFEVPEDRDPVSRHIYTEMDEEHVRAGVAAHNRKVAEAKARRKEELEVRKPAPGAAPSPKAGARDGGQALPAPGERSELPSVEP